MPSIKKHDMRNPRCTSVKVYAAWRACVPRVNIGDPGFCTDCLPWYQKSMSAQGMCDHPEVLFYRLEDGSVVGSSDILMLTHAETA